MASDGVERTKALSGFIASVIIPVVVFFVGHQYSNALKDSELQAEYISMATDIVADEPTAATRDLREWAVQVIKRYSEVPLTGTPATALKNTLRLPKPSFSDEALKDAISAARQSNDQEALRVFRRYAPGRVGRP